MHPGTENITAKNSSSLFLQTAFFHTVSGVKCSFLLYRYNVFDSPVIFAQIFF